MQALHAYHLQHHHPTDTLVSFDVESLFTNIPVDQACDIVKQCLEADTIPYKKEQDSILTRFMIYFSHTSTQHPSDGEKITTNENKAPLWDLLSQSSNCQHLHGTLRNPNLSSLPMSNPPSDSGMSGSGTAERNLTSSSNTSTSSTRASSSPWRLNKTTQSPSLISELPRKTKALLPTKSTSN